MGRPALDRALRIFLLTTFGLGALIGCASTPPAAKSEAAGTPSDAGSGIRALHGIPSKATPRLADVGDVGLLDDDSTMRDALVGGAGEIVIAATMSGTDDHFSLDLVVLNRSDAGFELNRRDLQVVDADGRWLEPLNSWEDGDRVGFSGRREERTNSPVVYEFDQERQLNSSRLMQNLDGEWGSTAGATKRPLPLRSEDRRKPLDAVTRNAVPEVAAPTGTPVRVVVPPADGSVFWGYFTGPEPTFPLTAVILVDGEQITFRFDR